MGKPLRKWRVPCCQVPQSDVQTMLKQRVITAVLLLVIIIASLVHPSDIPFGLVSVLLIAGASWEWARLNGCSQRTAVTVALVCAACCCGLWGVGALAYRYKALWLVAGGLWVLCGSWLLYRGVAAWGRIPGVWRLALGIGALVVAWIALMQLRAFGVVFLLSVLSLVWVADIAAYFAGKQLGGTWVARKLAPMISPGKSWEGALGGAAGVLTLAIGWVLWDQQYGPSTPSFYSVLARQGYAYMALCILFLTAWSVVGDLFESLIKRAAGAKDSSGLLPGHGGVLDRIDALLPTLPLAMMLLTARGL